jgi:hypothetical protein
MINVNGKKDHQTQQMKMKPVPTSLPIIGYSITISSPSENVLRFAFSNNQPHLAQLCDGYLAMEFYNQLVNFFTKGSLMQFDPNFMTFDQGKA